MAEQSIRVQVVYADAEHQLVKDLTLASGSTVQDAIRASGLEEVFPHNVVDAQRLGIFSRKVNLDHPLEEGDRVELYRRLALDPMSARRRRAR